VTSRIKLHLFAAAVMVAISAATGCSKDEGGGNPLRPNPQPGPAPLVGFFVDGARGSDDSSGTESAPLKTIQHGIEVASRAGGGKVFVAGGTYSERLNLKEKVKLHGGYDGATWQLDRQGHASEIVQAPFPVTVNRDSVTIDGFRIRCTDPTTSEVSAVGIQVKVARGAVISNNVIMVANGARGLDGVDVPYPMRIFRPFSGTASGFCSPERLGGQGGSCTIPNAEGGWSLAPGKRGGQGGSGGSFAGYGGNDAETVYPGYGHGGAGGATGYNGSPGQDGRDGSSGIHGQPGGSFGSLIAGIYLPANGTDGTFGSPGSPAGGGGGGGGNAFSCGGGGGGGGAGGIGGSRETGATGGTGSIGIIVADGATAEIQDNVIITGNGGAGGDTHGGLSGQPGGVGANGGSGNPLALVGAGGRGGDGGTGGNGGHGGAGGGGPSIGILESANSTATMSGNTFTIGQGGKGGTTEAAGRTNGADGIAAEHRKLM
jgi:hypothetical protein